ncbi:MAG: adenine phosphoribosyltransferase [Spirochaetales bacterium]|nr:adenine phosphoribosyltransferase [Spirochaetales bacterium]
MEYNLDNAIRKIPDFPKKGILFYDITGILMKPEAFNYCIDKMEELYASSGVNAIAVIESRGFLFGAPLAIRLKMPLILLRKKGKLPGETYSVKFTLEYGEDVIEVHKEDVDSSQNILLIDDLIATGGTLKAAIELLTKGGARVARVFGIVGLPFLNYADILKGYPVKTLINYHAE